MALSRLSEEERAACLVAERCLGVTAEAWDVGGRVGAVDAMLHFPDGRTGALEVTTVAGEGALQTANLLARDENSWPTSGVWCWTINVGSPRDLPQLRSCYQRIILACEAAGTPSPARIAWGPGADDDVRWLVQDSSCSMLGHPTARGDKVWAMVVPNGAGGAVDGELEGLVPALVEAFEQPHMAKHFEKLERADADERQLFIRLHDTAVPPGVALGLMFNSVGLPRVPPPVPAFVTRLWLAPPFTRRVLLWVRDAGWRNCYPYH